MFKTNKSNKLVTQYFIPTSLRIMTSDWSNLAQFIIQHGTAIKDKINIEQNSNQHYIPSEDQFNDALNGPYQRFITQSLNAQARVARVRLAHQIKDSDFFIDDNTLNNPDQIPERILKQSNLAECDNLTIDIDNHVANHAQQWEDCAYQWLEMVIEQLTGQQLSFTDIELKELADDETMTDLMNRYTELKIDQPKLAKQLGFSTYYKLKATLAVHSVLSREQKPHASSDIEKFTKSLKPLLEQINKEETQLLDIQLKELKTTLEHIDYDIDKKKK